MVPSAATAAPMRPTKAARTAQAGTTTTASRAACKKVGTGARYALLAARLARMAASISAEPPPV